MRDLFHVLYKLSKVRRLLEGKCYAMIATEMKLLISKCASETIDVHRIKMNNALTQFDLIEANIKELKKAVRIPVFPTGGSSVSVKKDVALCHFLFGQLQASG